MRKIGMDLSVHLFTRITGCQSVMKPTESVLQNCGKGGLKTV